MPSVTHTHTHNPITYSLGSDSFPDTHTHSHPPLDLPLIFTLEIKIKHLINRLSAHLIETTLASIKYSIYAGNENTSVLFNDAHNTFYLQLYGVRHMVKNHSDSERGNQLPPHGLLFPISSKGYFICITPQTG